MCCNFIHLNQLMLINYYCTIIHISSLSKVSRNKYTINPSLKSKVINDMKNHILFTWFRLSLRDLITSPINSKNGIVVVTESPYGKKLINIFRPGVTRMYYGKDVDYKNRLTKKGIGRISYGVLRGSQVVGTDPHNFVTKPFNYHVHMMAKHLHQLLMKNRINLDVHTMDLSTEFNHCTKLLYYGGENLKLSSLMDFHCDITYNHDGIYVKSKNGQRDRTPTIIVAMGDSRNLLWERQVLVVSKHGRKKWVTDKTFKSLVTLNNMSIIIVNPLDEISTYDHSIGLIVRYRHGGVKVTGNKLSIGFVFRVVNTWAVYDSDNMMVYPINGYPNTIPEMVGKIDTNAFHQDLLFLY